ncbi:MAG: hypothetical protein K2Q23_14210 [Bryobacteraceae bacterium]|nr:hypothetical protein [Bryobacteraceae bacterium]
MFAAWLGSWWPAATIIAWRQNLGLEWLAGQSAVVQLLALWLVKDFVQW